MAQSIGGIQHEAPNTSNTTATAAGVRCQVGRVHATFTAKPSKMNASVEAQANDPAMDVERGTSSSRSTEGCSAKLGIPPPEAEATSPTDAKAVGTRKSSHKLAIFGLAQVLVLVATVALTSKAVLTAWPRHEASTTGISDSPRLSAIIKLPGDGQAGQEEQRVRVALDAGDSPKWHLSTEIMDGEKPTCAHVLYTGGVRFAFTSNGSCTSTSHMTVTDCSTRWVGQSPEVLVSRRGGSNATVFDGDKLVALGNRTLLPLDGGSFLPPSSCEMDGSGHDAGQLGTGASLHDDVTSLAALRSQGAIAEGLFGCVAEALFGALQGIINGIKQALIDGLLQPLTTGFCELLKSQVLDSLRQHGKICISPVRVRASVRLGPLVLMGDQEAGEPVRVLRSCDRCAERSAFGSLAALRTPATATFCRWSIRALRRLRRCLSPAMMARPP